MKFMLIGVLDIYVYLLKDYEEKCGLRMNR